MALIAALLTEPADRAVLRASAPDHELAWAAGWHGLERLVRERPVVVAVAGLRADPRADGIRRAERFRQRFPRTALLVWGAPGPRERRRLEAAGIEGIVGAEQAGDGELADRLAGLSQGGLATALRRKLPESMRAEARALVLDTARDLAGRSRVLRASALAADRGVSVSTLERRCADWGLPTPGRLLLWLRVLQGLHWLLEPGRSVESVAGQLGYSSGAAFRRALRGTVGGRPTALRNERAFRRALDRFLAECGAASSRGRAGAKA